MVTAERDAARAENAKLIDELTKAKAQLVLFKVSGQAHWTEVHMRGVQMKRDEVIEAHKAAMGAGSQECFRAFTNSMGLIWEDPDPTSPRCVHGYLRFICYVCTPRSKEELARTACRYDGNKPQCIHCGRVSGYGTCQKSSSSNS
jgi:hypothetical protein